jgi:hypothetical protein
VFGAEGGRGAAISFFLQKEAILGNNFSFVQVFLLVAVQRAPLLV